MLSTCQTAQRVFVPLVALTLLATACGSTDTSSAEKAPGSETPTEPVSFKFRTPFSPTSGYAPFYAAQTLFWPELGLEGEVLPGTGSAAVVQSVGAGSEQMGYTQFSAAVAGIEKGVPITIIAVPTPRDASGIVYLESTGIQEWEDLEGKQVGNFPAGNTGAIVRSALETSGVDPNLVNFVNIQPGSEMSLLTAGRLEVLAGLAGAQDLWLRCSGVAAGSLPAYEAGVELFGQVVVANNSWMEEVGDEAVSKALLGIIKGFGLLKTEPEKALDQMNQLQPDAQTNLAQELASMDPEQGYTGWMMEGGASASTKGFAWIDEEQMQTSLDELARAGLAQAGNSENLDKFATTKYLEDPDVQRAALEVSDADFAPIDKSIREQCKLS